MFSFQLFWYFFEFNSIQKVYTNIHFNVCFIGVCVCVYAQMYIYIIYSIVVAVYKTRKQVQICNNNNNKKNQMKIGDIQIATAVNCCCDICR